MNASQNDRWVRRFTTDASYKHKNGFTIYKITSYLFPLASPEAVTILTVWKRYSDLQTLQRTIRKMHQDLHLKGNCPVYTKWGYFRRFDPEVIQDRMKTTQALLEFIASHPPLFTSTEFVNFFQSSYPDPDIENGTVGNIETIRRSLLLPVEVIGPLDNNQTSEDDSFSTVDSNSVSPLEGSPDEQIVFRNDAGQPIAVYPKSPRGESGRITKGILEDVAEVVVLPEPLAPRGTHQSEQGQPTTEQTTANDDNSIESNVDNIPEPSNTVAKLNLPDLLSFDTRLNMDTSVISSGSSSDSLSFLDSPSFNSMEVSKHSAQDNDLISFTKPSESVMSLQSGLGNNASTHNTFKPISKGPSRKSSRDTVDSASFMGSRSSSRLDTLSIDSLFGSTADLQESYVFEAGYFLSLGARHEAKGEYQKAFDFYKAGIEKMLIGVQGDSNEYRRQFVREKTNKYLSYAEKIYNNHLNNPDTMPEVAHPSKEAIPRPLKTCDVSSLRRPYEDLSKYRVLGVLGRQCMLVLCSQTQNCYAMKVVQKLCNQIPDEEFFTSSTVEEILPIMPTDIPYMVKLVAFIDTPNLLYLVLQYASGGKLFDYIKNYVKTVPETPNREVNLENVFIDPEVINKKRNSINHKDSFKFTEQIIESNDPEDNSTIVDGIDKCEIAEETVDVSSNLNLSVSDIVNNSQRLLSNVEDVLSGRYTVERDSKDCSIRECDDGTDRLVGNSRENDLTDKMDCIVVDGDMFRYKIASSHSALSPRSLCNWGAELLTAIDHLHQCGVYCRNLSPDDLLLGERGHLVLSYTLGWEMRHSLTLLLTEGGLLGDIHIAPELHNFPLLEHTYDQRLGDFWSFGVIMFQLLTGLPMSLTHPAGFNSHTILNIPEGLSKEAESLLSQLLCYDPRERLGSGPGGIKDIKAHEYFKHIDWDHIQHIYDDTS